MKVKSDGKKFLSILTGSFHRGCIWVFPHTQTLSCNSSYTGNNSCSERLNRPLFLRVLTRKISPEREDRWFLVWRTMLIFLFNVLIFILFSFYICSRYSCVSIIQLTSDFTNHLFMWLVLFTFFLIVIFLLSLTLF